MQHASSALTSRCATALKGLDDDHPAAAAGTGIRESLRLTVAGTVGATGLIVRCRHVKQPTDMRDVFDTPVVGEQTVVTDAVETIGQDALCTPHA